MREQEVRNLWEAYLEVCENQQLDELSDELVGRSVNARIAATGAANDAETRDRTPETVGNSVIAGKKEASMRTAAARRRKRINKEEVEVWVNALVEEGYDLSEYTWDDMCEMYLDEARRADREGYERGTAANPNRNDVPHSDPSQQTMLHSRLKGRADEMGRARRGSSAYKSGSRPALSKKEKGLLQASDRTSPGRGHVRNPNVPDTGSHKRFPSERRAQKDPKQNPKHSANRENAAESFDLFDTILEHLVAEGYADTNESALAIMANMSEEWRESIVVEASVTDDRVRSNQKAFGSNYTPPRDWDQSSNRGKGAVLNPKQKEKQRRKGLVRSAEEN